MKPILPLLILFLSCTDPHYIDTPIDVPPDTIHVDTTPICRLNGTAEIVCYNRTFADITVMLYSFSKADTFGVFTFPNDSVRTFTVKAGWFYCEQWSKYSTWSNLWFVYADTCARFGLVFRKNTLKILTNPPESLTNDFVD
jgi:hypothetical protein